MRKFNFIKTLESDSKNKMLTLMVVHAFLFIFLLMILTSPFMLLAISASHLLGLLMSLFYDPDKYVFGKWDIFWSMYFWTVFPFVGIYGLLFLNQNDE